MDGEFLDAASQEDSDAEEEEDEDEDEYETMTMTEAGDVGDAAVEQVTLNSILLQIKS